MHTFVMLFVVICMPVCVCNFIGDSILGLCLNEFGSILVDTCNDNKQVSLHQMPATISRECSYPDGGTGYI